MWNGYNEFHANIISRPQKNLKRIVKALVEVALGHMTCSTPCDHLVDIPTHLGPIEVLLEYFKGLTDAKVTG